MCRWMLMWVTMSSLVVAIPDEQQYCVARFRRLCQGKGLHVACQFPDAGPGSTCERYTPIKFTTDLKNFITHYLNRRRQRIAAGNERVRGGVHLPKPQIMMLVEWDRELAFLAQRLADQCHFVHDDCRATVRYPYAGQTVGEVRWRRSSESDELSAQRAIRRVLDAWWGERRRVQPKQLTTPFRLTARGTVWGHFSQLAVWNLQAVGCGAVRHGTHHPRLLLVCDFSHTNMLGQRTLVPGSIAPCPIHTTRKPRTAYPLLCSPFRHPIPTEPEEIETEHIYEEYEEEDNDVSSIEVEDIPSTKLWPSKPDRRWSNPKKKSTTTTDFPDMTRKIDAEIYRDFPASPTTLIESVVLRIDPDLEQKTRSKVPNMKANYKQVHNTFEINQFENILRNDWRKKPLTEQWRQKQQNSDNLEEVIPLTIPRREITETVEPKAAEVYRPKENSYHPKEVYRPKEEVYHPKEEVYRPKEEVYRPKEEAYRPKEEAYRPKEEAYRPKEEVYRPNEEAYRPKEEAYRPKEEAYRPKEEVYRPKEHISRSPLEDYRSSVQPTIREDITNHDVSNFRPRWRQTRIRPLRPGANALLTLTTIGKPATKKEYTVASLHLDKEDIDQLFRDTGFNIHWRKQTT